MCLKPLFKGTELYREVKRASDGLGVMSQCFIVAMLLTI